MSDKRILMQRKPQRGSKDISVTYILICEKMTNFLRVPPISLNGTAEAGPTSELITETAEMMIRQFVKTESKGIRKTESKIKYCSGRRENRFKQSKVSSEEKVKIHKL